MNKDIRVVNRRPCNLGDLIPGVAEPGRGKGQGPPKI